MISKLRVKFEVIWWRISEDLMKENEELLVVFALELHAGNGAMRRQLR